MKNLSGFTLTFAFTCALLSSAICTAQTAPESDAVYQALGSKGGIKKIVDDFLPIVLADARIKDSFKDTDIERLGFMLTEQFCQVSGGPCGYSGKDMKTAHAGRHITNAQFNALAEDLQVAMDKHGIPSSTQNKLLAKLAPMQRDVVTK